MSSQFPFIQHFLNSNGPSTQKEQTLSAISPRSRELLVYNYTLLFMETVYIKSESSPRIRQKKKNPSQNIARACVYSFSCQFHPQHTLFSDMPSPCATDVWALHLRLRVSSSKLYKFTRVGPRSSVRDSTQKRTHQLWAGDFVRRWLCCFFWRR